MQKVDFFGTNITACTQEKQLNKIKELIENDKCSYITYTNVHVVVSARGDEKLKDAINSACIASPDGMPLVWIAKAKGFENIERCCGPDMMDCILKMSCEMGLENYFYGGSEDTITLLDKKLREKYNGIKIVGIHSPPYRILSEKEKCAVAKEINELSPDLIWVGLGAPKQELWMKEFKDRLNRGIMLGVGAAFDFQAGNNKRAPKWMQNLGLEWFYRLLCEPKRLFKRYFITNSLFIIFLIYEKVRKKIRMYK